MTTKSFETSEKCSLTGNRYFLSLFPSLTWTNFHSHTCYRRSWSSCSVWLIGGWLSLSLFLVILSSRKFSSFYRCLAHSLFNSPVRSHTHNMWAHLLVHSPNTATLYIQLVCENALGRKALVSGRERKRENERYKKFIRRRHKSRIA